MYATDAMNNLSNIHKLYYNLLYITAETVPENMSIYEHLMERTTFNKQILEIEVGVVGGEEDGYAAEIDEKRYTTEEDGMPIVRALATGETGGYITPPIFGTVHGAYKPGSVQLRPGLLNDLQVAVVPELGRNNP